MHREFVHHIVEDEVDGQEDEKDDKREDRQQRENGEFVENQTHNMSAWRWRMTCDVLTRQTYDWRQVCACCATLKKMWRMKCAVHTHRRLQHTAVSCKRSDNKKFKIPLWVSWWVCVQNKSPCSKCCSFHELGSNWHSLIYALHQCSFHCHQDVLDEEDDECHVWHWSKWLGSGRSSPDSRWRRCIFVSASRKSDRSFIYTNWVVFLC